MNNYTPQEEQITPTIDYARLEEIKRKYLCDMDIYKKSVFLLDGTESSDCWHCGEQIGDKKTIPLSAGDVGAFCCVNCTYSYIATHVLDWGTSVINVLDTIKNKHGVSSFTLVPPREFKSTNEAYLKIINDIKYGNPDKQDYFTSLQYIDNKLRFIINKY